MVRWHHQLNRHEKWNQVKAAQSCPTLCDPMDYSPPGSSVHGILQAKTLEWVAIAFSRGSSQPRYWTQVPWIAGQFFTIWAIREAQEYWSGYPISSPVDLRDLGIELASPALQADSLPARRVWATVGDGEGQGSLACCNPWSHKDETGAHYTEWSKPER